jgi:DNA-binding MarR family transcriptional regulator
LYLHVNDPIMTMTKDMTGGTQVNDDLSRELCSEVLRSCGSFNLRRASRVATRLYDEILQPTGLRSTQIVVMVALAMEPELSMVRLARELILSPSTLSRTVQLLERDNLVRASGGGRRGKCLKLTRRGRTALLAAIPYWQRAQEEFTGLVGANNWDALSERLSRVVSAMRS